MGSANWRDVAKSAKGRNAPLENPPLVCCSCSSAALSWRETDERTGRRMTEARGKGSAESGSRPGTDRDRTAAGRAQVATPRAFRAGSRDGLSLGQQKCGGGRGTSALNNDHLQDTHLGRVVVPHEVARFGTKSSSAGTRLEEWRGIRDRMTDLHAVGNKRWLMDGWAGDHTDIAEMPLTAAAWTLRRASRAKVDWSQTPSSLG
ncbi:hypothetical protein B0T18DRAFT_8546 [Schizothecium vesticola]|uniref:Uncharacterized protein n=1 Tax=Schizothecium vesticola TaxID=314040 RepID=A0AA40KBY4_9PEZI|nr:hypothetical protein B0T18DRAFT_8546 [Schizothecium vesticola]